MIGFNIIGDIKCILLDILVKCLMVFNIIVVVLFIKLEFLLVNIVLFFNFNVIIG